MPYSSDLSSLRSVRGLGLALSLLLASFFIGSAQASTPRLDVHYVPTPHEVVARMLEMADVQPEDYVIDLGSGDGRIVIAAVRDRNVRRALGIDLDPERVSEARENARKEGVEDRAVFEQGDLFQKDFSDATVLTMYLLSSLNLRLKPMILERMAPGTRIVSHAFDMGEWVPDRHDEVGGRNIYLWIVPARVAGRWQIETSDGHALTLMLDQTYQHISGRALEDGVQSVLGDLALNGREIRFSVGPQRYVGIVDGDTIVGVQGAGSASNWSARRM